MRLLIVEGYREIFLPRPVQLTSLLPTLVELEPAVTFLDAPWAPRGMPYHTFVEASDPDRTCRLLLEYAMDTCRPGDARAVVLPSLRCNAAPATGHVAQRFAEAARDTLGAERVRSVCIALSTEMIETLRIAGGTGSMKASEPRGYEEVVIEEIDEDARATLEANYTEAVLTLVERRGPANSVLRATPGRARLLAEMLRANHLSLSAHTPASEVQRSLAPGGELYELFWRGLLGAQDARS